MINLPIETLYGYHVVETTAITKRIQRKKHKKWRINKKWLKRYGYKTVLDNDRLIIHGNVIYATPKLCEKLRVILKGGADK